METLAGVKAPDSRLARDAIGLAREASSPMLFNHVMRSYWFAALFAEAEGSRSDREIIFLSSVLHDLGLTDRAGGPARFEIEGAHAAQAFLLSRGCEPDRAWLVWDTIALHTGDVNLHKQPEARAVQAGILCDVTGFALDRIDPGAVAEVLARYPRLDFKRSFPSLLEAEARRQPHSVAFHPFTMIRHHCGEPVDIPDARAIIEAADFPE